LDPTSLDSKDVLEEAHWSGMPKLGQHSHFSPPQAIGDIVSLLHTIADEPLTVENTYYFTKERLQFASAKALRALLKCSCPSAALDVVCVRTTDLL